MWDVLKIYVPITLLVVAGFIFTWQFVDPAPPKEITIATGSPNGSYSAFAERYRELLGAKGLTLKIRHTAGTGENLRLLADPESGVDVALVQGGVGDPAAETAVNATHIFGIALLVGAIVPLNLRFLGFWRRVPREPLVRVLVPVAMVGLALAIAAGFLLFTVKPQHYAGLGVFQLKLVLVAAGILGALVLHRMRGFLLRDAEDAVLARHAVLSIVCWTGALACGRLIAFAGD